MGIVKFKTPEPKTRMVTHERGYFLYEDYRIHVMGWPVNVTVITDHSEQYTQLLAKSYYADIESNYQHIEEKEAIENEAIKRVKSYSLFC